MRHGVYVDNVIVLSTVALGMPRLGARDAGVHAHGEGVAVELLGGRKRGRGQRPSPDPLLSQAQGALHDVLIGRRPLNEVKRRGRWRSDGSVRRYEKTAVALGQLNAMTAASLQYNRLVECRLALLFASPGLTPPPPARVTRTRS